MGKNNLPEELFDLLSTKGYDELSSDEIVMVKEFVTQQEYSDMRNAISNLLLADRKASSKLKGLRPFQKRNTVLQRVLNYQIPVYKIAVSLLLICGLFAIIDKRTEASFSDNTLDKNKIGIPIDNISYPDDLVFEL